MFHYNHNEPLIIAGFGNILLSDEGVGVEVIKKLSQQALPKSITLYDGGTNSLDFISQLTNYSQAILIDAILTSHQESDLLEFSLNDVHFNEKAIEWSLHEMTLNQMFQLMNLLDIAIPRVLIIGIKIQQFEIGMGISKKVEPLVESVVQKINLLVGGQYA